MFGRLFRRDSEANVIATSLYGAIVAQARSPAFYARYGVADSVDGRFDMVILHLILVLDRLQAGGAEEQAMGQRVFDLYCTDMDRSLREMGIGDFGVPKRMKKMTEAFYGRAAVYREAIAAGDAPALAAALARNVFRSAEVPEGAALLARYALAAAATLAPAPPYAPRFPDPDQQSAAVQA